MIFVLASTILKSGVWQQLHRGRISSPPYLQWALDGQNIHSVRPLTFYFKAPDYSIQRSPKCVQLWFRDVLDSAESCQKQISSWSSKQNYFFVAEYGTQLLNIRYFVALLISGRWRWLVTVRGVSSMQASSSLHHTASANLASQFSHFHSFCKFGK